VFDFLDGPVRDLVTTVYGAVGYVGVALWVVIESVIMPIPSELVLPFAGFLVGDGAAREPLTGQPWNLWLTILSGTIGATGGACIAYAIGYYGGRPVIERWGRWIGVTPTDLDRAESFFTRHGDGAAFFGRLLPVVRSLVSFAAGVGRMPVRRFVAFTFMGSALWTALLVSAGSVAGARWDDIGAFLDRFEYVILGILAVCATAWIWFRIVKPWRTRRERGTI
jgi:membrane protein DedA with SNARE-associated domain